MIGRNSTRWRSGSEADIDAYLLTDGSWLLFAYVKDQARAADDSHWRALAEQFSREAGGAVVTGVARALKSEKGSEPLPALAARAGGAVPPEVWCREGWMRFRLETEKVLNPGLFLDQALNRQRLVELIQNALARQEGRLGEHEGVLNLFSYTGSFSIAALTAGAKATTSIDVSSRYLDWEKQNFEANFGGLDVSHKVLSDDARDFLRRAAKKGAKWRWIIIDPPTFSRGQGKPFKVQEDLRELIENAVRCLSPGGAILASSNDARWRASDFNAQMADIARAHGLRSESGAYPEEFGKDYPLKSVWLSVAPGAC